MSQENVEAVRRGLEAFQRGDRAAVMRLLDPEATWYPRLGALLDHSQYSGPEDICRMLFDEIPTVLEGFSSELHEVRDLGRDRVLAKVTFRGRVASAGMDVEQTFWHVYRMRDRKPIELRAYAGEAEALEAVERRE